MFVLTAVGFCPKQPQLKVIRPDLCKLEFELCAKRFTRGEEVIESATFVVWNDEAQRLAEKLVPGVELMVTGRQETSRYEVDGSPRSRTVYALTDLQFLQRRSPASQHESGQGQSLGQQGGQRGYGGMQHSPQPSQPPRQQRPGYRPAPQDQQESPAQPGVQQRQVAAQHSAQATGPRTDVDGFEY